MSSIAKTTRFLGVLLILQVLIGDPGFRTAHAQQLCPLKKQRSPVDVLNLINLQPSDLEMHYQGLASELEAQTFEVTTNQVFKHSNAKKERQLEKAIELKVQPFILDLGRKKIRKIFDIPENHSRSIEALDYGDSKGYTCFVQRKEPGNRSTAFGPLDSHQKVTLVPLQLKTKFDEAVWLEPISLPKYYNGQERYFTVSTSLEFDVFVDQLPTSVRLICTVVERRTESLQDLLTDSGSELKFGKMLPPRIWNALLSQCPHS